jgi:hypothetical protein
MGEARALNIGSVSTLTCPTRNNTVACPIQVASKVLACAGSSAGVSKGKGKPWALGGTFFNGLSMPKRSHCQLRNRLSEPAVSALWLLRYTTLLAQPANAAKSRNIFIDMRIVHHCSFMYS